MFPFLFLKMKKMFLKLKKNELISSSSPPDPTSPITQPELLETKVDAEAEEEIEGDSEMIQIELEPKQFQNLLESMIFIKNMVMQMNDRIQRIESNLDLLKRNVVVHEEIIPITINEIHFSSHEVENGLKQRNISGDVELLKKFINPRFMRIRDKKFEFFNANGWITEDISTIKIDHLLNKIQKLYLSRNNDPMDDEMDVKQRHIIQFMDNTYRRLLIKNFITCCSN